MTCEMINKTALPVRVKTPLEEKVLLPEESARFWCTSVITAGLSFLGESTRKLSLGKRFKRILCRFRPRGERDRFLSRFNRMLLSIFDGNLGWEYHFVIDGAYSFSDIADGERFAISCVEEEFELGNIFTAPRLARENGGECDRFKRFPKEDDELVTRYKKTTRAARYAGLVFILLYTCGLIVGSLLVNRLIASLIGGVIFYTFANVLWCLFAVVILFAANVKGTVMPYMDEDNISEFCEENGF